jgi:hypothetical protein
MRIDWRCGSLRDLNLLEVVRGMCAPHDIDIMRSTHASISFEMFRNVFACPKDSERVVQITWI